MPLDLSNAQEQKFEPVKPGTFFGLVSACEMRQTSGRGNLPEGTEYYNLTWVLESDDEEVQGRKVWTSHYIITKDTTKKGYPADKAKKMTDALYTALLYLGFSEEELRTPGFDPQPADFIDRSAWLQVTIREQKSDTGVKETNNIRILSPESE